MSLLLRRALAEHLLAVEEWVVCAERLAEAKHADELTLARMAKLRDLDLKRRLDTSSNLDAKRWVAYGPDCVLLEASLMRTHVQHS